MAISAWSLYNPALIAIGACPVASNPVLRDSPVRTHGSNKSPYTIIEYTAGNKAVEYIYKQYNEIVTKVRA